MWKPLLEMFTQFQVVILKTTGFCCFWFLKPFFTLLQGMSAYSRFSNLAGLSPSNDVLGSFLCPDEKLAQNMYHTIGLLWPLYLWWPWLNARPPKVQRVPNTWAILLDIMFFPRATFVIFSSRSSFCHPIFLELRHFLHTTYDILWILMVLVIVSL